MTGRLVLVVVALAVVAGGMGGCGKPLDTSVALSTARAGHTTQLTEKIADGEAVPVPPEDLRLVSYPSPLGQFPAYLSVPREPSRKHPAIVWVPGGFCHSLGPHAWEAANRSNDQSARVFRQRGIVTLYPSLRGGNENAGCHESFYGEVDDLVAAGRFLRTVDYVDPERIYLGGHSTGGTLVLLVAEASSVYRAVFALGPVEDPVAYGRGHLHYSVFDERERRLRAPIHWLHGIRNPTFVFEGAGGNVESLRALCRRGNSQLHCHEVPGHDHFTVIWPVSNAIAGKILADTGPSCSIRFTAAELQGGR